MHGYTAANDILSRDVRALRGVGEAKAKALAALGIPKVMDLAYYVPKAYEDRTTYRDIAGLEEGRKYLFKATVKALPPPTVHGAGLTVYRAVVEDVTGSAECVWFNQRYAASRLSLGKAYAFYGECDGSSGKRRVRRPEVFGADEDVTGMYPVYGLTEGITQNGLRALTKGLMARLVEDGYASLPKAVCERYGLAGLLESIKAMHWPATMEEALKARRRLAFEEFFYMQLALAGHKKSYVGGHAGVCGTAKRTPPDLADFIGSLPFRLTEAQRRTIGEVCSDMAGSDIMNRLVQGDVGSGKTAVAAAAAFVAARNGFQSAYMAPMGILAAQHLRTFTAYLGPFGIKVGLLVGDMDARSRREALRGLASGETAVAVGTHALIQGGVEFKNLGLVVADEQHKFGVGQRAGLYGKGAAPDLMVMTATPIPRTMALAVYGDMDVSVMDGMPPGRTPVDTYCVGGALRERVYAFIRKNVGEGRQAFVVCPFVEEPGEGEGKSVLEYGKELAGGALAGLRVDTVHGRMRQSEKDSAMMRFAEGETDVLVSSTVVEVGVDVPNASLMVVEGAERFGLSQLHQLRGRVGRGAHKSWCVLITDDKGGESARRMDAICSTGDGFKVAEMDLELRGAGEFFGLRQHGDMGFRVADIWRDAATLGEAQECAFDVMEGRLPLSAEDVMVIEEQLKAMPEGYRSLVIG